MIDILNRPAHDIRQAIRSLRRTPSFTAAAVATMAIGIAAVVTVASVVQSVLLSPLPFFRPERLVRIVESGPAARSPNGVVQRRVDNSVTVGELLEIRYRARSISQVAAYVNAQGTLTDGSQAARLEGWRVEPEMFELLGTPPLLGRTLQPADRSAAVVVIGHETWQHSLGGRADVVGTSIALDERVHTIIGVMPKEFAFPIELPAHDYWTPLALETTTADARGVRLPTIARLADGVSMADASGEVSTILRATGSRNNYGMVSAHEHWVAPIRDALLAVSGAVALLFLIAAVNLSGLFLGRTAARRPEMAIRSALGIGRARLVHFLIAESVGVSAVGCALGIALALLGLSWLRHLAATLPRMDLGVSMAFPRLAEVAIHPPVLWFVAAVSITAGVICGLVPALYFTRTSSTATLRTGAATMTSERSRVRHVLVAGQVGLATILLLGAAVVSHSFYRLASVEIGYEPSRVLTFQVALPAGKYRGPALERFAEALVARVGRAPGVTTATYAPLLPMVTLLEHRALLRRSPALPQGQPSDDDLRGVGHDYFRVMGIAVMAGRGFTADDRAGHPRVVVINQAMARRHFTNENPIGKQVYLARQPDPWEIVGVVADVRQMGPAEDVKPQAFVASLQWPGMAPGLRFLQYFAARVEEGDPRSLAPHLRTIVRDLDPAAAVYHVAPMADLVGNAVSRPRLYAVIGSTFSVIALLMATVGLYGTVSYQVAARTREIGVRMALGASRRAVLGLVLRDSTILTIAGWAVGSVAGFWSSRYLESLVFGPSGANAGALVVVILVLGTAATAATIIPARRALAVDPLLTLRQE
jgi:putative ABC transport system permease protein